MPVNSSGQYVAPTFVNNNAPALDADEMNGMAGAAAGAVEYDRTQALSAAQKAKARSNIDAGSSQDVAALQTAVGQLSNQFTFKGECTYAELPTTGNRVNDTWYVTDRDYNMTWNGTEWKQSSAPIQIDSTLTEEGQAADALATGEAINGLQEEIDTANEKIDNKLGIADYSAAAAVGLADNLIDRKTPGELNTWTGMRTACGDQSIEDDGNAEIVEMIGETAMNGSHVELTAIKTVGFNAYNNTTGTAKLLGGHEYQITGSYTALTYSTGETIEPDGNGLFTPTADGVLTVTGGNATNTCVHLTWSGYRNGDYEPYWEQVKQIDLSEVFPYGMNGSACYNQYGTKIGGKYEMHDTLTAQKAIRWINRVNIKDCNIAKGSNENCWVVQSGFDGQYIPGSNSGVNYIPGFQNSKGWSITSYNSFIGNIRDKYICPRARTSRGCIFCDVDYATYWQNNDVEGMKAAMGDVYVYYLLTTPVETEFEEPLNLIYRVSDFGTEEVLNGSSEGSFNGKIRYSTNYVRAVANLRDSKITKPTNAEEQLAVLTLLGCTVDAQGIVHFGGGN